jgi:hypothetical protein
MRGLRSQSSVGLELRTADEMDADVARRKKSYLSPSKVPHVPDEFGDVVEAATFDLNDNVGAGYTTDNRG